MSDERDAARLSKLVGYEDLVGNIRALVGKTDMELLEAVRLTVRELHEAERAAMNTRVLQKAQQEAVVQNEKTRRELSIVRRILAATKDETTVEAACRVQDTIELAEGDRDAARRMAGGLRSEAGWGEPGQKKFWPFPWE